MADTIINQSLLSAINAQNISAQNLGQGTVNQQAASTVAANIPEALLNAPLAATVTTNPQLGQVQVNVPQLANFLPQAEVSISTNQTQLQQGQQVQIQLPEANSFTRVNNTLIANINITTSDTNTGATQNFNGRVNIVLPNQQSSGAQNNNFIQQNISNPDALVGKNFSAYFISTPDKNIVQNISNQNPQASPLQGVPQASLASDNISGLQIKISNITLPNSANTNAVVNTPNINSNISSNINSAPSTPNFNASVVFSGDNEIILNTNLGTLRLPVNLQLPVGTNLQFNIAGLDLKDVAANKEIQITNLETLRQYLSSDSTALKDLLGALTNSQNNAAQAAANQAAQAQVPNVTDKFIFSRAIWFLGNVANNSPDKWLSDDSKKILGKNSSSPDAGKLEGKLSGLFSTLKSFFSPADAQPQVNAGAWNNFTIPFLDSENKLNYVNFYTEQNSNSIDEQNGKSALRFIVELNNSYFGEVQIDGLLTRPDNVTPQAVQSKKLDVIFRYSSDISDADKAELRETFLNSIEISGLKGDIQFRQTEIDDIPRPYNNPDFTNNNHGQISSISPNGYVI